MKVGYFALTGALLLLASCGNKEAKKVEEPAPAQYKVKLQTTKGDAILLIHRDWSPNGADRFYELVKRGYYNENYVFRALKGFVVQWGMNGDPAVNKRWRDITMKDDPAKVSNKVGTITFASAGPNSRTTQVFINLADNSGSLDSQGFTPFGEVVQGLENVMNFHTGYGDGPPGGAGPDQAAIADIGNPYLEEHFPKLDIIKKAQIIP